ncbi:hypothetical protein X777_07114 [Ooceraea biroi]|uniref:Uncharacterized protein n=1 Tax=Ooceraea biroi TaxID=2015173 RepID=A0A026W9U5_OOCBI|nr:hypothetical protein X777_07114 [Ooceraea biroi]
MTLEDRRLSLPPKWVNPCGLADEVEGIEGSDSEIQLKDDQLLQQIVVQATTARMHTELFRERYESDKISEAVDSNKSESEAAPSVKDVFKSDLHEFHSTWKHNRYEWLPGPSEIPKSLGEHLSLEHLQSLTLDEALLNAYEYLQKFAVGLEQIVWDQEDHQLKYRNEFKETEYKLRTVLCEIQVALVERGITQRPDITRDIMVPSIRNMDSETYRDLRDWMIFRDYMNGLEYVVQVFEYLRAHPQHTS